MKPNYILIILLALLANVTQAQIITTVAGGDTTFLGNGGPATNAQIAAGIVRTDGIGNVYITDRSAIRKIDAAGIITTIAGGGTITTLADGQNARDVLLKIQGMAVDSTGNVYIIYYDIKKVIKINTAGIINIVAGNGTSSYNGDGSVATSTGIGYITAIAVDALGNFYIAADGTVVRKVDASGIITTVAGIVGASGYGYTGDGGQATAARLNVVQRLTTDKLGNLFILHNAPVNTKFLSVIRKVNSNGIISTLTSSDYNIEGGFTDFGTDNSGNLYISRGNKIQRVDPQANITTVAGTGSFGFSGDGGPATSAQLGIASIAVDDNSNIYVTDRFRLRKINESNIINTIAGNGLYSFSGDDGPATKAALGSLDNLASDRFGNLYIADQRNHVIRKVNPAGIISTVAGNKTLGFSGDGGLALNAQLNSPGNVSIDSIGNIYINDFGNRRIRKLDQSGIITTIAGNGSAEVTVEGVPATSTGIYPQHIAVSKGGTIYFIQDAMIEKVATNGIISRVAGRRGSQTQGYSGDGGLGDKCNVKASWTYLCR
jgi:hypothetical protein